jgi:hypothetical protein
MKKGILAGRRQLAIETISEKTGIDLSPSKFPVKAMNVDLRQLFQLEILAEELPEKGAETETDIDRVLAIIEETKGVGPSLFEKIKGELKDNGFAN